MSNSSAKSIEVFISYSHRDEKLRDELSKHLSLLKRQGTISEWHDRRIQAGEKWAGAIDERLNAAQVILLLVSADFLASDYCHEIEMKRALERHGNGEAIVVPVILRPCDWEEALFGPLQALPKNAKAVTQWRNQDDAFAGIARGIRKVIKEKFGDAASQTPSSISSPNPPGVPKRGEMVPLLCDRTSQEDDFDDFIHGQSAQVLLTVVPGEARECPDSFSKRLTGTIIKDYARERWGTLGIYDEKMIPWPELGAPAEVRKKRLLTRIYREFYRDAREISPKAFVQAFADKLEKVIVLRHGIRAELWEQGEKELLQSYLSFWDEVNVLQPAPQFVVFLNMLYPSKPGGILSLFQRARFNREEFNRQLLELLNGRDDGTGCPKLLLEELGCITPKHVNDWFDQHNLFDEGERHRRIAALFKKTKCLPMNEIEGELKRLHLEFTAQGGRQ